MYVRIFCFMNHNNSMSAPSHKECVSAIAKTHFETNSQQSYNTSNVAWTA